MTEADTEQSSTSQPGTLEADGQLELSPDVGYADALDELEDILAQLESSTVDVDVLADRVARGAELVRFCRNRLRSVRVEVDTVVDELIGGVDARPSAGGDGDADGGHRG
jgi:exodeoxyribonuclease VII small subunit